MKHIADRGYTDVVLNKHIEKDAVLEEEYEKAGVELTEERKRYLVDERKLYKEVEGEDTTPVVEDNNEEVEEEEATPAAEDNNEEVEEEEATPVAKETTKKNTNKNGTKNTKKNDKK